MVAPAIKLYDGQKKWLADKSRFKIGRITRQYGKSFMTSLEAVDTGMETAHNQIILSAGERQSKEVIEKAKMHCKAYMLAASEIEEGVFPASDAEYAMLTIHLPNGARIIGLPANPDTARGFTGDVTLDEFAMHKNSKKIWTALFPTITRGFKIRVVSTPQGLGNKFHDLCTNDNNWSKHVIDIFQAVKEGLPLDIEELKAGLDDPDAWEQEYLVKFIDEATAWLIYELITACQTDSVPKELEYGDLNDALLAKIAASIQGRVYAGFDIARRRDLTVLDIEDKVGDVFWNRATVIFPKVRLTTQKEMLWRIMDCIKIERICIDSSGMGLSLGEDTVAKYGSYRVEQIEFTNKVKEDMAVRTRHIFEDRRCRIPICTKLRDDLHAVKKITTASNHFRFDAERTDKGHADRFWAKSLAFMASDEGADKPELIVLG